MLVQKITTDIIDNVIEILLNDEISYMNVEKIDGEYYIEYKTEKHNESKMSTRVKFVTTLKLLKDIIACNIENSNFIVRYEPDKEVYFNSYSYSEQEYKEKTKDINKTKINNLLTELKILTKELDVKTDLFKKISKGKQQKTIQLSINEIVNELLEVL